MATLMLFEIVLQAVVIITKVLVYGIIGRIIFSWLSMGQGPFRKKSRFELVLEELTEPILNLARKLPHRIGMLDLSPIIAIFILDFIPYLLLMFINLLG